MESQSPGVKVGVMMVIGSLDPLGVLERRLIYDVED